jgi:hypothetical protein
MAVIKKITIDKMAVVGKVFIKSINDYRENVVQTVHWTCKLIDGETEIEESVHGSTYFQYPEDDFLEYSELTKEKILSWLEDHPDIDYRVSKITERFNKKIEEFNNLKSNIIDFNSLPEK